MWCSMSFTILRFFLCLIAFSSIAWAQDADRIIRIDVAGNERIDRGVVLNAVKTKEKDPYDLQKLREDMKSVYRTGFFNDVQIDVRDVDGGKAVTFVVIERPTISGIYVTGNKKLKTSDLRDKLKIQANQVFNVEKVKESLDEIKKLYASKGYYAAKVTYEIEQGERYDVAVKFFVEEPAKAYVKKIAFTGNKAFKGSKLQDYMRTKEKGIFSWFTGSGILDEDALEDDKKNIEVFYSDNGYIRTKVGIPDIAISKDGKSITITLPIEEGSIYKIGSIDFAGDVMFPKEQLLASLKTKPGDTFRSTLFQEDLITLGDLYRDQGYAFCEVNPLTKVDDNALRVDLTFEIVRGTEIFFNRINISGNVKTRDKVVRRELRVAEGDRFSATKLKESQRRLRNTTFFKNVDMKIQKTEDPAKANLDITVEEKPTGSLSAGVGYNADDKVILSGSIAQENFLGTGRKLYLEAALSAITTSYRLSFVDPYVFDLDLGLGVNLYNYGRIMPSYEYRKKGGGFSLTRPLTDFVKGGFGYRLDSTDVFNIDPLASIYVKEQAGEKTTSAVSFSLAKNTIDDVLNPTKGINTSITLEIAGGPLGGNNEFVKSVGFYGRYFPIKFAESAFFARGTAGTIQTYGGTLIPIYEKFFVGGIDTIRGFNYGMAGPLDNMGDPIGGKNQMFFNFEWIFPIFKPAGIKGVLFYDVGGASDDNSIWRLGDLKQGAGFGVRWFSPLGPIRLELGFNLSPKEGEKRSVFDFAIGTRY